MSCTNKYTLMSQQVAGHALAKTYGKQFQKMLSFLCNEYLPRFVCSPHN